MALLACGAAAAPLVASRALLERLETQGRAVATFEHHAIDPFSGEARRQRGTVSLEPPDRARLDFTGTGESITMRSDGGEWLQPELRQLLRLGPRQAEAARRWWSLLLPGASERFAERALGKRRYQVTLAGGGEEDRAWVTLGTDGLPSALEFSGVDGEPVTVRFSGWRFARPKGKGAFVLSAPDGFEVVDVP